MIDKETIDLLKIVINNDGRINLPAEGDSMFPFIQRGDICSFTVCPSSSLKRGDIVLFCTENRQLVAHRFYHNKISNDQLLYIFKGDTNLGFDKPIREEQIIGKLVLVQKNRFKINTEDLTAFVWAKIILTLPMISGLLRRYLNKKRFL